MKHSENATASSLKNPRPPSSRGLAHDCRSIKRLRFDAVALQGAFLLNVLVNSKPS